MLQSERNRKTISILDKLKDKGLPEKSSQSPIGEWDVTDEYEIDPITGEKRPKKDADSALGGVTSVGISR